MFSENMAKVAKFTYFWVVKGPGGPLPPRKKAIFKNLSASAHIPLERAPKTWYNSVFSENLAMVAKMAIFGGSRVLSDPCPPQKITLRKISQRRDLRHSTKHPKLGIISTFHQILLLILRARGKKLEIMTDLVHFGLFSDTLSSVAPPTRKTWTWDPRQFVAST
jgi:hypothetical protein